MSPEARLGQHLQSLTPDTKRKALILIALCADQGIPLRVTQSMRSLEAQEAIYAQGRQGITEVNALRARAGLAVITSAENVIVTKAQPGYSWHNFGMAFDVVPMTLAEKLGVSWATPHWAKIGALGKSIGLEWGGDFPSPDKPHFQNPEGNTLADLRSQLT